MATYKIGQIITGKGKQLDNVIEWCFWNTCALQCIGIDTYKIVIYEESLDNFPLVLLYQIESFTAVQLQLCKEIDIKRYNKLLEYFKIVQKKTRSKNSVDVEVTNE